MTSNKSNHLINVSSDLNVPVIEEPQSKKVRLMDGFSLEPGKNIKYLDWFPSTTRWGRKTAKPFMGLEENSQTIAFNLKLGSREVVRFSEEPFSMEYKIELTNMDKLDAAQVAAYPAAHNNDPVPARFLVDKIHLQSKQLTQYPYVIPHSLRGRTFFSDLEVVINGVS